MISTPYDHIAEKFSALRTHLYPKEQEYLAIVLDQLRKQSKILDLGCGTGIPIAEYIASFGHHLVGVDGSEAMLCIARKCLPNHQWIHALMEEVEFEESFDAVICWDSLFHLPFEQHHPVISKVHRWLAPGGRLMVSSGGLVGEQNGGFTDTMFGHEFFYDSLPPKEMVAMMEEVGFEILLAEMCDPPDGLRNKGKWATVASKK